MADAGGATAARLPLCRAAPEARGLVGRRPDPADRRVKVAAATEAGLQVARELREGLWRMPEA